jgi:octaprenyl-diphosphate synthase
MPSLKEEIAGAVAEELQDIETALAADLGARLELVRMIAGHTLFAGGKRLRPLLMVLAAKLCGVPGQGCARLSTIFEYLHTATLLHDDVVDGASVRRGKPAGHVVYGAPAAVLVGDFLLARTGVIAAETGSLEIILAMSEVIGTMSEGELQQMQNAGRADLSEAEYEEVIYRKTAVLMETACKTGALFAGAPKDSVACLGEYGRRLGLAFQMKDDLLDYESSQEAMGKPVGQDLAEGKMTLPLIAALARAPENDAEKVRRIVTERKAGPDEFAYVRRLIQETGGMETTRKRAAFHIDKAREALAGFPDTRERQLLLKLADYILVLEA